jgi:UDP-GlcNAc:undecaprenyl-phosphate/decaprenyl-phosphate GlcNAc-1-phosphate transferase
MLTYTVAFLLAAAVAFVLTPLVRWGANRFQLHDDPSAARKVHDAPIPRLGGLAIAAAFFVPVMGLWFVDNGVSDAYLSDPYRVIGLVGGALFVVGVGLLDDLRDLPAWVKLLAQVAVAVAVYFLGYDISRLATPFGFMLELGWFGLPVTVLWIVGVMNAINFIDGLDGLASGVSLFTVVTLFALSLVNGNFVVGMTSVALAGALVGFLRYNFNPATIFMGDSGSLFLGFVLATTAISGSAKSSTAVALMIPILALGLPLFDTGMAVVRRLVSGRDVFSADRGHVHHRLLDLGLSHRQVVLALYGVCLLFTLLALSLVYASNVVSALVLLAFLGAVLTFAKLVGLLDMRAFNQSVRYGLLRQQKARIHLESIERAVVEVRTAPDHAALIDTLERLADDVRLDELHLHAAVHGPRGLEPCDYEWIREDTRGRAREGRPVQLLEHTLDWSLGSVEMVGRVSFAWHCDHDALQIPEAPGYHLLALCIRDRLLQLAVQASTVPLGPRLVER